MITIRGKYERSQLTWLQRRKQKPPHRSRLGERIFALLLALTLLHGSAGYGLILWRENRDFEREKQAQLLQLQQEKQRVLDAYDRAFQAAEDASLRGDYKEATEYLGFCLSLVEPGDPLEAELRSSRAAASLLLGDAASAIGDLQRLVELEPDNAQAMRLMAQAELDSGGFPQAARDLEQYLRLEPADHPAMETLAQLYEAEEDYSQAADWYAVLAEQKDAEVYLLQSARCRILAEEFSQAEPLLNQYLDPEVPRENLGQGYYLRGMNRMLGGNPAAAIPDFITAVAAGYDPASAIEQAVSCAYLAGDSRNLLGFAAEYEKLPQKGTGAAMVYRLAGLSALELGDLWAAEQWLDRSLKEDPDQSGTIYSRALILFERKRYNDAVGDFTAALEAGYLPQRSRYNRGLCLLRMGHRDEGIADLTLAAAGEDPEIQKAAAAMLAQLEKKL